ncbi:ammonium transporter Amt1 [Trichoglossum hirsutum]|uniref:Ammonium transporter n=1 Tax=Trichoglossum hirsutum TaxID=265104 RepID=A0A9P8LCW5_9PEZI|nr:ammonium transporter Amt1 [Trichoglossum hirsutum]
MSASTGASSTVNTMGSITSSATDTISSAISVVSATGIAAATDLPPSFVPIVAYNNSPSETGGDSLVEDLTIFYDRGDLAWMIAASALVLLMVPGVGYFYSGLARRKSALSLVLLSMFSTAIVGFQWVLWGYSLTFSHSGGPFIGSLENIGFRNVLAQPSVGSPKVPDLLFAIYQGMFAAITPALAVGAATDRGRLLPACVFIFVWATLIYDPIAFWAWNPKGWLFKLGYLDFAGGTPVHMASGSAALAYSFMLGRRYGYDKVHGLPYRPHNVTHVILGTVFLWVGWFGFNGGSALSANMRAIMACVVTHTAASVSAMTWCFMDMRLDGKMSAVGFCSGAVVGLVAITPGSGFVPVWAAVIFGVVVGIVCNLATKLKYYLGIDDSIDIFASHCVAGFVGNILTAFFAA